MLGLESVHAGPAVRDSGRKRFRLSHATTGCAPPTSVLDALERDLMDCGSEPSRHLEAIDISVGDTDDDELPGSAVVQMASNSLVPCDRLAEVTHGLTGTQLDSSTHSGDP